MKTTTVSKHGWISVSTSSSSPLSLPPLLSLPPPPPPPRHWRLGGRPIYEHSSSMEKRNGEERGVASWVYAGCKVFFWVQFHCSRTAAAHLLLALIVCWLEEGLAGIIHYGATLIQVLYLVSFFNFNFDPRSEKGKSTIFFSFSIQSCKGISVISVRLSVSLSVSLSDSQSGIGGIGTSCYPASTTQQQIYGDWVDTHTQTSIQSLLSHLSVLVALIQRSPFVIHYSPSIILFCLALLLHCDCTNPPPLLLLLLTFPLFDVISINQLFTRVTNCPSPFFCHRLEPPFALSHPTLAHCASALPVSWQPLLLSLPLSFFRLFCVQA